ncbi:MAG: hypothetical protein CMH50_12345 [Myxococcales bacterium]|nr:hypothetical protein [Myxococcales bacterium]
MMRSSYLLIAALALVAPTSGAYAQQDGLDDLLDLGDLDGGTDEGGEGEAEATGGDGESESSEATGDGQRAGEATDGDAGEESGDRRRPGGVIDPRDETIFTIQKKGRYVGQRFELAVMGAASINNKFTYHTGGLLNGIYHFAETMSVQGSVGFLQGDYTAMTQELLHSKSLTPPGADYALMSWYTGADVQWSPIYGKFRLAGKLLGHFDLYMGVGAGLTGAQIKVVSNTGSSSSIGEERQELKTKIVSNMGAGLRFYFTEHFGVRVEFRDYVISHSVQDEFNPTDELQLGVGNSKVTQNSVDVANVMLFQFGPSWNF